MILVALSKQQSVAKAEEACPVEKERMVHIKHLSSFTGKREEKRIGRSLRRTKRMCRLISASNGPVITLCNDMLLHLWFPGRMMDDDGELIVPLLTDTHTWLTPVPSGPTPGPPEPCLPIHSPRQILHSAQIPVKFPPYLFCRTSPPFFYSLSCSVFLSIHFFWPQSFRVF